MRVELERMRGEGMGGPVRETKVVIRKAEEPIPANGREVPDDTPLHDWQRAGEAPAAAPVVED